MTPTTLRIIMAALTERTTNVTEVAARLGLDRTTVYLYVKYVKGDGSPKVRASPADERSVRPWAARVSCDPGLRGGHRTTDTVQSSLRRAHMPTRNYREIVMHKDYIITRDGGYWIGATRVALDSVVYRFLEGLSPESIAESFPVLTLEQVYGAITYYLAHRAAIDAYLQAHNTDYAAFRQQLRAQYPRPSRRLDALLQPAETLRA